MEKGADKHDGFVEEVFSEEVSEKMSGKGRVSEGKTGKQSGVERRVGKRRE
jgi:hypothetical protein